MESKHHFPHDHLCARDGGNAGVHSGTCAEHIAFPNSRIFHSNGFTIAYRRIKRKVEENPKLPSLEPEHHLCSQQALVSLMYARMEATDLSTSSECTPVTCRLNEKYFGNPTPYLNPPPSTRTVKAPQMPSLYLFPPPKQSRPCRNPIRKKSTPPGPQNPAPAHLPSSPLLSSFYQSQHDDTANDSAPGSGGPALRYQHRCQRSSCAVEPSAGDTVPGMCVS